MSPTAQHQQQRHQPALVPSRAIDLVPICNSFTSTLEHARDPLPKAANGRTIAPSNDRAAQFLKQIGGGISDPIYQVTQITVTNLDDGVPLHTATAWLSRMQTFFSVYAKSLQRRAPRSIVAASNQEFRQQMTTDLAERRVFREQTCDEAALVECIRESRKHAAALEEVAVACEAELASRHSSRIHALKALQS